MTHLATGKGITIGLSWLREISEKVERSNVGIIKLVLRSLFEVDILNAKDKAI